VVVFIADAPTGGESLNLQAICLCAAPESGTRNGEMPGDGNSAGNGIFDDRRNAPVNLAATYTLINTGLKAQAFVNKY
jgi:hypothetical protein